MNPQPNPIFHDPPRCLRRRGMAALYKWRKLRLRHIGPSILSLSDTNIGYWRILAGLSRSFSFQC
ncbi:hypothetical protein C8R41DRAFT_842693 [Lentinula lateritia]|uniref:Uncharacterized protein n=1 Tax=Lentinula lateritia TaxID=40482 RepID=A0ABQ8V8L6_9AGAR|nr:hypothetical protein C8R41DRAFT_842693 [Lentinula lateritia]